MLDSENNNGYQTATEDILLLAGLGDWGKRPGNCSRDLKKYIGRGCVFPTSTVLVPCIDSKGLRTKILHEDAGLMDPSSTVYILSRHFPDEFDRIFGVSKLSQFWRGVRRDDPRFLDHPLFMQPGYETMYIPIWIHGPRSFHLLTFP